MNPVASPPGSRRDSGPRARHGVTTPIGQMRLQLQAEGPRSIRWHLLRAVTRVISLAGLDASTYFVLRAVIRLLRDDQALGGAVAQKVGGVFPLGSLGGIQFVTALVLGLFVFGAYGQGDARRDSTRIARGVLAASMLTLWSKFWLSSPLEVAWQGLLMTGVMWSGVSVGRQLFEQLVQFVFRTSPEKEPVVFVGDRTDSEATWAHTALIGKNRDRAIAWVDLRAAGAEGPEFIERTVERIHGALRTAKAHTIVLCGELPKLTFEAIVEAASSAGIRVLALARFSGAVHSSTSFVWYNRTPFIELTVPGLKGWQQLVKRVLDIVMASVGLVLLAPVFGAIALAIKLDSRGPVFFRQERVGYAGRAFRLWKFRTMRTTAEQEKASLSHLNASGDHRLFKIPNDPRVTRVGAFLRRWSLDEFPQFINVLAGEMSMVGPRPFFMSDLAGYHDHHFARLGAKPGITGLWQVQGRSDVTDFEDVVRLDRAYIERWSVLLDVEILFRTVPAVLRRSGAY